MNKGRSALVVDGFKLSIKYDQTLNLKQKKGNPNNKHSTYAYFRYSDSSIHDKMIVIHSVSEQRKASIRERENREEQNKEI